MTADLADRPIGHPPYALSLSPRLLKEINILSPVFEAPERERILSVMDSLVRDAKARQAYQAHA
jgi:hypothetical protein